MKGAADAMELYDNPEIEENDCYKYAVARHYLHKSENKSVEMYVTYDPNYTQFCEWLKQLYGESEGKEGKALLPSAVTFSTDLHSLGQYIQEGTPLMFETVIFVKEANYDVKVGHDDANLDGLNYLEGKDVSFINSKAMEGTLQAHVVDGKIPNIYIEVTRMDAYHLGAMFYFFEKACAMSAYLLGVNPFNQPGVEIYKRRMFQLLGKPGY
jgi:glucose-6-phosphate isomerase